MHTFERHAKPLYGERKKCVGIQLIRKRESPYKLHTDTGVHYLIFPSSFHSPSYNNRPLLIRALPTSGADRVGKDLDHLDRLYKKP